MRKNYTVLLKIKKFKTAHQTGSGISDDPERQRITEQKLFGLTEKTSPSE